MDGGLVVWLDAQDPIETAWHTACMAGAFGVLAWQAHQIEPVVSSTLLGGFTPGARASGAFLGQLTRLAGAIVRLAQRVDAHHHLFGASSDKIYYRRQDMEGDLASGHEVAGTMYIAAHGAGWRTDGPQEMRSVGEVERIVALSATPLSTPHGPCGPAAGIVSDLDLVLGDSVGAVLREHARQAKTDCAVCATTPLTMTATSRWTCPVSTDG